LRIFGPIEAFERAIQLSYRLILRLNPLGKILGAVVQVMPEHPARKVRTPGVFLFAGGPQEFA
jgi:hypothetical protein